MRWREGNLTRNVCSCQPSITRASTTLVSILDSNLGPSRLTERATKLALGDGASTKQHCGIDGNTKSEEQSSPAVVVLLYLHPCNQCGGRAGLTRL